VGRFHAELEKGTKAKSLGAQTVGKDTQMPKEPSGADGVPSINV
jgi:hypothetical protein